MTKTKTKPYHIVELGDLEIKAITPEERARRNEKAQRTRYMNRMKKLDAAWEANNEKLALESELEFRAQYPYRAEVLFYYEVEKIEEAMARGVFAGEPVLRRCTRPEDDAFMIFGSKNENDLLLLKMLVPNLF